jgi:hypothetical protein
MRYCILALTFTPKSHILVILLTFEINRQSLLQADIYTDQSGGCVAFLANIDSDKDKVVTFRNRQYDLPAWSVSILPDCKNVVFNTAKVLDFLSAVCFSE